ncbi:hypothetical protein Lal_00044731 [Lupinus albus]|nr:hypothetical protein Lal_00044731 [Lupinus albus]
MDEYLKNLSLQSIGDNENVSPFNRLQAPFVPNELYLSFVLNYNAGTKNLTVVSSYPGSEVYTISYVVDLRNVLPEWVRVGLTGASGGRVEVHSIQVWDFSSTLQYTNNGNNNKDQGIYIASVIEIIRDIVNNFSDEEDIELCCDDDEDLEIDISEPVNITYRTSSSFFVSN